MMDGIPPEKTREFLESLECPVCKEICPPPLFNCIGGHTVCGECSERLKNCPLCSGKITATRNRTVEDITALLQLKCTNTGCGKYFRGDLFKTHVAHECNFRPIPCYCQTSIKCNGKDIELSKYEQHLIQVHESHGSETHQEVYKYFHTEGYLEEISDSHHRIYYMKYDGKLFMLNHRFNQKVFYSWVTLAGSDSEKEAQKYDASLTYYEPSSLTKARCSFKVCVHSFRKPLESIQTSGHFVGLPIRWLIPVAEKSEHHHQKRIKIDYEYQLRVTIRIARKEESG